MTEQPIQISRINELYQRAVVGESSRLSLIVEAAESGIGVNVAVAIISGCERIGRERREAVLGTSDPVVLPEVNGVVFEGPSAPMPVEFIS